MTPLAVIFFFGASLFPADGDWQAHFLRAEIRQQSEVSTNGDHALGNPQYQETITKLRERLNRQQVPVENPHALIEANVALKTNRQGTRYDPGYRHKALRRAKAARTKGGALLPWVERGPGNVSGRVRAIAVDPTDASGRTWFAASIAGGIWKTTNAGLSWEEKSSELSTLTTTTLAIAPSNPDVLYAGTGMGYGRVVEITGSGVWKSTDHGESWFQLASTANGELLQAINRIVVDPNDENVVLVASNDTFSHLTPRGGTRRSAIFRSGDGGNSWQTVFDADAVLGTTTDNRVQQIVSHPEDFSRLYAAVNEVGVIRSLDAGQTWSVVANDFALPGDIGVPSSNGFGLAGISVRTELAVAPSNPQRVYAAVERPRGVADLLVSNNGGDSWTLLNDTGSDPNWFNAFGQSGAVGYTAGWFNNTLTVHPNNPNLVFLGGVNLYLTAVNLSSATRTTTPIAWWFAGTGIPFVHADHHWLASIPGGGNSFRLIDGNDGGVGYSTDGGVNWSQRTGMVTSMFYGADKKPGEPVYIGGTQDNGTWLSPSDPGAQSSWTHVIGGDGFEAVWNVRDSNLVLGGSQGNGLMRSTDAGLTWQPTLRNGAGAGPFITKIANSEADPDLVFVIDSNGVWRSDDFGASWINVPITGNWLGYRPYDNVEVSIADPQTVWITSRLDIDPPLGAPGGIHRSDDGGLSFVEISQNLPPEVTEASGLATHPSDSDTAYLLFAAPEIPKILRTRDRGQTWEDLSGFSDAGSKTAFSPRGFPDVPVFSLLVMPYDEDVLWAGTDIGLVESTDGGQNWQLADNGLPNVNIFELRIVDQEVLVSTQGRGIWTVALPQLSGYTPPEVTLSPRLTQAALSPDGDLIVQADLRSVYDSSAVIVNGEAIAILSTNQAGEQLSFTLPVSDDGMAEVVVESRVANRSFRSASRQVALYDVALSEAFSSGLGQASAGEFVSVGGVNEFTLSTPQGFANSALHTPHPYSNGQQVIAQLRDAFLVPCDGAEMRFDEIVLVEPGLGSGQFGDPSFFDFVVVEGSNDGVNWIPLADGYDSRDQSIWSTTYAMNAPGDPSLYRERVIDVSDTFLPGERIFVRFRLFADSLVGGWGWAVDNIALFANATPGTADCLVVNNVGMSGAWFNPARDGEGWIIETLADGRALVYWFTYPPTAGGQAWMLGVGEIDAGRIIFDSASPLNITGGASFGAGFDPADVVVQTWGTGEFAFETCATGAMQYAGPAEFGSGDLPYQRLTGVVDAECRLVSPELAASDGIAKHLASHKAVSLLDGISGSWFNVDRNGEGWILERLPNGGALMTWFTYTPDGQQAFIVASTGPDQVSDDMIQFDQAVITSGTVFGPGFDPGDVVAIPWGSVTFNFSGCDAGSVSYESSLAEFGQGGVNITRLTRLAGVQCIQ